MKYITIICNFCNKSFEKYYPVYKKAIQSNSKMYCSHRCSTEHRKEGKEQKCQVCFIYFYRSPKDVKRRKTDNSYCSRKCLQQEIKVKNKEKIERTCKYCNTILKIGYKTNIKICSTCKESNRKKARVESKLSRITKKELFEKRKNWQSARSSIVHNAKVIYELSGKIKECIICGYDKHYQVCHIKAVKDFPNDAYISEINSVNNLVALCSNHHWEYDNGLISLQEDN